VTVTIARALRRLSLRTPGQGGAGARPPCSRRRVDGSLAEGSAGLAVFYAQLAEADAGLFPGADQWALAYLSDAVDRLAIEPRGPALFDGFSGTAWAVAHLEGRFFTTEEGDANEAVDRTVLHFLGGSRWRHHFNLVDGLAGLGVYALERLPRRMGIDCLKLVVDRLNETAQHDHAEGITWFTAPRFLSAGQRSECPEGHYNLGLAHGVPGIIALLGQICARREEGLSHARRKARALLDGAVPWLLAQQPPGQSFPYWTGPGVEPRPARLGWCYGDLQIAAALIQAARGTGNDAWEEEALRIARDAAGRAAENSGVADCGLCHGGAGVAHLFNRLYQATGEPPFKRAARSWIERTLAMLKTNNGIGGVAKVTPAPALPRRTCWTAEPGILEGSAGVALALLAAIQDVEPAWDRMLLVSIPPRAEP